MEDSKISQAICCKCKPTAPQQANCTEKVLENTRTLKTKTCLKWQNEKLAEDNNKLDVTYGHITEIKKNTRRVAQAIRVNVNVYG